MGDLDTMPPLRGGRVRLAAAFASVLLLALLLVVARPAVAEVVEGDCVGTATIGDAVVVDAATGTEPVVTIPPSGTVTVEGSVPVDAATEVSSTGELRARSPFGSFELSSWSGTTADGVASGTRSYALPSFLPRGSGPITLELGLHVGDERCVILGVVAIDGPTFDALTVSLLLVTLLALVALVAAGRAGRNGRGRPVVGALAGTLAGVTGAAAAFGAGLLSLDSPVWWLAPLALLALGTALGAVAPFRGAAPRDDRGAAVADGGGQQAVDGR